MFRTAQHFVLASILTGLLAVAQGQQTAKHDAGATAVFRSQSRLVLLDVVVTDAAGHSINGLKASDFTVLEDGKPQTILAFHEQDSRGTQSNPQAIVLPEHEYTNYEADEAKARTVVLVDALNSDREDLANARNRLLQFLKKMPAGQEVAIYALGSQLMQLQSFTSNPKLLEAAAERLATRPGWTNYDNRRLSADINEAARVVTDPRMLAMIASDLAEEHDAKLEMRTQYTFEALAQLARSLAVIPGRKNLIWLSGGFTLDSDNMSGLQHAAELLAATRIVVYPVDARGKVVLTARADTESTEAFSQTTPYEDNVGLKEESMSREDSMLNLARLTGGKAYFGRNDLDQEIAQAIDTGSRYYTIAHRPSNADWNGKYRKLRVKIARPGAKALCRAGYFAVADPLKTKDNPDREAAIAMNPLAPLSTQMIMKVRVLPPQAAGGPVEIGMLVDAHAISFNKSSDGRQSADLQFIAVATTADGKPSASFSEFFRQPVTKEQLDSLLKTGIQLNKQLQLPAGSYVLRLGIMDRLANRIGTLDVPLTIAATTKN
jgi:VWFA-related protein